MLDEVDLKFNEILQVLEQGNNSTDLITKAYTIARVSGFGWVPMSTGLSLHLHWTTFFLSGFSQVF